MRRLTTLAIGDYRREEFREALEALRTGTDVIAVSTPDEVERILLGDWGHAPEDPIPDLMIIAQSWPGQFSAEQVLRLKRLAPLTRVLALLGSWCEGETRTGCPWSAASRVFWYDWTPRWHDELDRLSHGRCPTWGLPDTAGAEERLLWTVDAPLPVGEGLVLIHARCRETADALGDACRGCGYWAERIELRGEAVVPTSEPPPQVNTAVAALWEGTRCDPYEAEHLRRLAAALGSAPVVALLDFPRLDDRQRALAAGASCVVSKPFLLNDLFRQLDQAIGQRTRREVTAPFPSGHPAG